MKSTALKQDNHVSVALAPVVMSKDMAQIDSIARELREHAVNLRYTFRDESAYKSLTDYFVIRMVTQAIPLIGANMDHVKMHVNLIVTP